jgi:AraC-like DNA-binding protein
MYREFAPSPRLADFVECYWHRQDARPIAIQRVLPDGCCDLLFTEQKGEPTGLAFVGLMTAARAIPVSAGAGFFGVRFRPAMAGAFFPDFAASVDSTTALDHARDWRLFEQLAEAGSVEQRMWRAEEYLGNPRVSPAMVALGRGGDVSPRHLRRLCLETAGVSPKHLARILRFRKAAEALGQGRVNWADHAAAHGYFDQAHMIRDFHEFAGCTPGRFLQSLREDVPLESAHGK